MSGPLTTRERSPALDVLRGFALLGILVVNLRYFRGQQRIQGDLGPGSPWWDRVAEGLVVALAEARFYPLFGFLFGYGFTVMLRRAVGRGERFTPRYLRRAAGLFVLGLLHALLLFSGDILAAYALLGLLLLAVTRASGRTLLGIGIPWALFSAVVYAALVGVSAGLDAQGQAAQAFAADAEATATVYTDGSFAEVALLRLQDWAINLAALPLIGGTIVLAFLLGHWAARRGLLEDPAAHRRLLARCAAVGLPVGALGGAVHAVALDRLAGTGGEAPLLLAATGFLHQVSAPFLTAGYVGALALVAARGTGARRTSLVASAGRLALTNYLTQSLVASLVFAGYGLGLYGEVGAAASLGIAAVLWSVQLVVSAAYLRRLDFGPVEYLLRWWTYRARPAPVVAVGQR